MLQTDIQAAGKPLNRAERRRLDRDRKKALRGGGAEGRSNARYMALLQEGLSKQGAGDVAAARVLYDQARMLKPEEAEGHFLTGLTAMEMEDYAAAVALMAAAIKINPTGKGYHHNLGRAFFKADKHDRAMICFQQARSLEPDNAQVHCDIGVIFQKQGQPARAVEHFLRALELEPGHASSLSGLGYVLRDLQQFDDTVACLREAIAKNPGNSSFKMNLAEIYKEMGRLEESRDIYLEIMAAEPEEVLAYRGWAAVEKKPEQGPVVETMERLFGRSDLTDSRRIQLAFALADVFHKLKDYKKAFGYLDQGNALQRGKLSYQADAEFRTTGRLSAVFDEAFFEKHQGMGSEDETPIFIIGMPRSGTSLVEQILASHPDVYGAGELEDLRRICTLGNQAGFPETLADLGADKLEIMAGEYLARLRSFDPDVKHISDKMPHNFVFVGMIRAMFPKATVIHCRRDPMDTCLSIYRKLFTGIHPYAYDLTELGQHYREYERLMDHWHMVLPGFVHDVRYEEVVADTEQQIRRILDLCGLDFHPDCLNFHETKRAVMTASNAQVRKPIYKKLGQGLEEI